MKSRSEMGEDIGLSSDKRGSALQPDKVRELAYMYWLNEGKPEGRSHEHWRRAERALQTSEGATLFEEHHLTHPVEGRLDGRVTKEKSSKVESAPPAKPRKAAKSKETRA